jgi:glutaredoxin 2
MILKAFREKTNKDYIDKLLQGRQSNVSAGKVKTIAVLLNVDEFDDAEAFRSYFKELGVISPMNKVVYFSAEGTKGEWETSFGKDDFGWKGKIKNPELEQFLNQPYDVLLGYYNSDISEMHQIIAMSKANLKVGIHHHDERLFDLILNLSVIRFDIFKTEFKKYLTILNKL